MANQISKYLRQAGVTSPYEDQTEAQITEANKANPLGSFGIQSAQQKTQREAQMRYMEEQQRREQEMMQQQLIARMSSQEKIGHYTGAGLMGLMQHLKGKGNAPEIPNAPPTDDPQLERYNQLASEVGPETAMQMLAQETGNAGMLQEAQRMRTAKDEASLDAKYKNSQIANMESQMADRAKTETKPNNVITVQRTGPDGKPMQASLEVYGKDPKTGQNLYRELGQAVKGSITGTKAEWETSKGGINERTKAMEGALTSTANALDAYDRMGELVKTAPAGLGWTGSLISKADDIISGVRNVAKEVASAEGRALEASLDSGEYNFDKLDKVAGASNKMKSLVFQLAYAQAAATGDSSRSLSDRDVQNQIDIIGGSITNPKNFSALMEQNKQVLVQKLENLGKYSRIDGQAIGPAYADDIAGLKKRVGLGAKEAAPSSSLDNMTDEQKMQRLKQLRDKRAGK